MVSLGSRAETPLLLHSFDGSMQHHVVDSWIFYFVLKGVGNDSIWLAVRRQVQAVATRNNMNPLQEAQSTLLSLFCFNLECHLIFYTCA